MTIGPHQKSRISIFALGAVCLIAGLWPSAVLPCEQEIRPGQTLKLGRNWRFQPGPNNPAFRETNFNDANWQRTEMPMYLGDHESTRKYSGNIWFRCNLNLSEEFFVRERPPASDPVAPESVDAAPPSATEDGDSANPASEPETNPGAVRPAEVAPLPGTPGTGPALTPGSDPVREGTIDGPPPTEDAPIQPGRGQPDPNASRESGTLEDPPPPPEGASPPPAPPGTEPATPAGSPGDGADNPSAAEADDDDAEAEADFDAALDEELDFELGPPRLQGMGDLAIYLGKVGDADIVYFNGQQIGQTGVPDPANAAYDFEKPRLYSIPHELWRPGKNVISIMTLSTTPASGFPGIPEIVREQERARQLFRADAPAIVFSFIYILVATPFFFFALFFHEQREHLFFALFSLFLGIYNLCRTNMRYVMFEGFTFETTYQIELIVLMLLPVTFVNFIIHLIGHKNTRPLYVLYGCFGLLMLATTFTRVPLYWAALVNLNLLMLLIAIAVAGTILYRNYSVSRENLKYVLAGLVPLLMAIAYDMFVTFFDFPWLRITVFAFLIFLGFAGRQLAGSILRLFHRMREQEEDLLGLEKRKTRSIFNLSREFNVILEGIYNGLSHLENRSTPEGKKGARKTERGKKPNIDRSMRNLENLVGDSRMIQLLESSDYAERNVTFSLRKMSEEVIERALVATGETRNRKRLVLALPDEEVHVNGDPDLLSTALYHLVENALYYSTGRIEIYAEREYSALKFTVRDEGPGMGPEQQRMIFQKFVRGSDDDEVPGIGIGLPIVDLIARQLHGELRLESGQGFFSTFIFQIPMPPDQRAA